MGDALKTMFVHAVGAMLLALPCAGCGSRPMHRADRVTVTGRVTCGGQPLAGGSIVLYSATSESLGSGAIAEDGTFRCTDVPVGPVVCVIENDSLKPYAAGRTLQRVNAAANSKTTSPLKADVTADGPNDLAFDVSPPPK